MLTTYHIALCSGDDFNAIYHIISHGGDYKNASRNCDNFDTMYHIVSHGGDYDNASRNCNDFNMTFHIIVSYGGNNDNASTTSHIISPRAMAVTMMTMRYKGRNTTTAAIAYYLFMGSGLTQNIG